MVPSGQFWNARAQLGWLHSAPFPGLAHSMPVFSAFRPHANCDIVLACCCVWCGPVQWGNVSIDGGPSWNPTRSATIAVEAELDGEFEPIGGSSSWGGLAVATSLEQPPPITAVEITLQPRRTLHSKASTSSGYDAHDDIPGGGSGLGIGGGAAARKRKESAKKGGSKGGKPHTHQTEVAGLDDATVQEAVEYLPRHLSKGGATKVVVLCERAADGSTVSHTAKQMHSQHIHKYALVGIVVPGGGGKVGAPHRGAT
jgi:hypothetical protein